MCWHVERLFSADNRTEQRSDELCCLRRVGWQRAAAAVGLALAAGQCHQVGYDTLRGDPFFNLDMRVAKNIRVREGWNLQLIFKHLT